MATGIRNTKYEIRKRLRGIVFFLVFLLFLFAVLPALPTGGRFAFNVFALSEECSQSQIPFGRLDVCIAEIEREVGALKPAHEKNKEELVGLKKQLTNIQNQVKNLNNQLIRLGNDIKKREEDLVLQEELLKTRIRSFYVRSREYSPLLVFLSSGTATELTRELVIREQAANDDRRIIEKLSGELADLKKDKETLERNRAGLQKVQAQVDERAKFLGGEVEKVESYLRSLTGKQQQLLAQKAGGFETSVGDTPPTLEPCSGPPGSSNYCDPGFSGFAVFSFGAPHRKGMSQFGALGRAKSGQNAEDILHAYYGNVEIKKDYDPNKQIGVAGYGRMDIETYVKRIYEVPNSWGDQGGMEALKAQAIAARSYALAWTREGSGGNICTNEGCQVYKNSDKGGNWEAAVNATRGWVLTKDGKIVSAWYASTAGGYQQSYDALAYLKDGSSYNTPGFWDTPSGKDGWPDNAYEKKSGSPWFYKAWYRTRGGATCGKNNPWLKSEEMADILNAWQVLYKGGGDVSRVSPLTTDCWPGNPYSAGELGNIGGYTNVSSASVVYGNDGSTIEVNFSTNKGTLIVSGEEFRKAFNLRASGHIGVKSSLFNIVRTN